MMRTKCTLGVVVVCLWTLGLRASSHPAPPEPERRIPVLALGYRPPGQLYLLSERTFSTLNFIDADHLLFTFHQARLLHRETDAGKSDADQIIRAVTLKLPEGTVDSTAEWQMHDRGRYLWPIGDGKFLVRQRDSYRLTDASLTLRPWLDVPTTIFASDISPDGSVLAIEHAFERHTTDQHEKLQAQAEKFGDAPPAEDTQITLLDLHDRKVRAALHTENPIHLPVTSGGYVAVNKDKGEDQFMVDYYPFGGKTVALGRIASTCTPHENFVSSQALMIESCGPKSDATFLDTWTVEGKKLWSGTRDGHFVWPTFAFTATGTRFALGLLRVAHTINLADSLNQEDVREQVVQVYDVGTGTLLFSVSASPVLAAGQNFALSADGEHLAVLRQGAIEIYKVPASKP